MKSSSSQAKTKTEKAKQQCNYTNNYYGDCVCVAVVSQ